MSRLIDAIIRYGQKDTSSLAFWWLPLYEGSGNYCLSNKSYGDYYLDFSAKSKYDVLFDDNGVLLLDYKGNIGIQYNPCAIAQYGLGLCAQYINEHDEKLKSKINIQAMWIVSNMKIDDKGIGRLEYTFSGDEYQQIRNENYISAIAQGQAISFLIRAGLLLQKEEFFEAAGRLFESYKYTVFEGGIVNYDEQHRMYLEEALTKKVSCILDGFIYAMFGAYDYYLYSKDIEAKRIFDECCITVKMRLFDFDLGFWSRADCYLEKPKMPASSFYHNVHVQQLKALYIITGEEEFDVYAKKWEGYQKNIFFRIAAFLYKCWFKIFYY